MAQKDYFQKSRKKTFTKKLLDNGLNASSCILFSLKDAGQGFLEELPNSYPGFALMKWTLGVGPYKKKGLEFKRDTVRANLRRLRKDGLITKDSKKKVYFLTDDGKKLVTYVRDRFFILTSKWDGKLRLVIFDVPEKKKHWRRLIREELLLMEYKQIQKSVYAGKHPLSQSFCKELDEAGMGSCIFIFTVDKVDRKEKILEMLKNN